MLLIFNVPSTVIQDSARFSIILKEKYTGDYLFNIQLEINSGMEGLNYYHTDVTYFMCLLNTACKNPCAG